VFDLALAAKLAAEGGTVVPNDFRLEGGERVVGPDHLLAGHRKRLPDRAEGHKAKSVPCTPQHGPEGTGLARRGDA
jgi:hypothetical protein